MSEQTISALVEEGKATAGPPATPLAGSCRRCRSTADSSRCTA